MTELLSSIPPFDVLVYSIGLTLLHSLWQCSAIGVIAWLALRSLPKATAQTRYAVSCAALAACVLWPAAQLAHVLLAPLTPLTAAMVMPTADLSVGQGMSGLLSESLLSGKPIPLDRALRWIAAFWAAGACLMLLRLGVGLRWVSRLRSSADVTHDFAWQLRLDRLAQRFGLSQVRLAVLDGRSTPASGPFVSGIWRPMVLVPASLIARMPVDMLEALLAHELAHIRRHDYLVNLFQRAAEAFLFYHPAVWWLSRRIRVEREYIADDLAVSVLGERRCLAFALAELGRLSSPTQSLAQAAHGGHLMSRIQTLLRPERRTPAGSALLPLAGLAFACIGCFAYAQTRATSVVAPKVTVGTIAAAATPTAAATLTRDGTYALVDSKSNRISMSGDTADIDAIHAAKSRADGDFLWFRRDGKAYVLRDTAILERVRRVWSTSAHRDAKMEALSAQIEAHAGQIEAISRRIEAAARVHQETPEASKAMRDLQALANRQAALAREQTTIATAISADMADEKAAAETEDRIDALDAQMEKLDAEIEALENIIEAQAERQEAGLEPLATIQAELEAATQPLEALDAKMEVLSVEQERDMAKIDQQIRSIIDQAVEKGLASPAVDGQ